MEMNVTYAPHPLTTQGREARLARWEEGRTIREHLIACGVDTQREIVIYHNTRLLTVSEWDVVCPRPGDFLHVEGVVSGGGDGSNPIAAILSIVVMIYAPYLAPALIGIEGAAVMGSTMTAIVSAAITATVTIAGNLIISAMFKPSQASSATQSIAAASPTYSLSGGSNRIRPYEPLPVLMGNHRIFPDYGAKPYTEFEGEDQYLYQVFNFGLGNLVLADLRIGETLLSTYSDVTVTRAENGVLPGFWGNVDSAEGAALSNAVGWVTRTTGTATTQISLDLVGTYYYVNKKGGLSARSANFEIEYCVAGTGNWQPFIPTGLSAVTSYWSRGYWANTISDPYYDGEGNYVPGGVTSSTWVQVAYDTNVSPAAHVENSDGGSGTIWRYVPIGADPRPADSYASNTNTLTLSGASSKPLRRTVSRSVASGQYDVRVRRTSADETDSKFQSTTEWVVLRSYQEGVADYSNQTVLGIKIKASGQLNGVLEQLSALGTQSTWVWSGGVWNWATTTNPAWWYLNLARGMKDANGKLLYGGGLSDDQIDIDGIKAWAVFCEANELSFSAVFDLATTLADALQTIARCGFASPSWGSGKLGVVWDAPNQSPVMAFGMANICKGSFEVSYVTDNLADEIVVNYTDRNKSWESGQVRVTVPGTVGTPVKPSTVDLMGCTTNAHAAKFANALAAQQYYRRRNITWETDFEGFVCQRGDVVILSHDLTQWGYSGRLMAVAGDVVTLSKPVPRSGASDYLMIQSPDGDTEVFTLTAGEGESDTLTLPAPFALQSGYAAIDHKWYFSPLPTPGKKVKITSVQPLSETRIRLTATDEYPEYYAAWNGVFTQPATQTLLDQNGVSVSDLTLTLNQLIIDGFQINRLTASWRQRGGVESCTMSAWLDGAPVGTWTGIKGTAHTLDLSEQTGTVIVEVTPIGTHGPGASVIASIDLQQLPAPAAPTLTVTGGLFAVNATWGFGDEREDIRSTEIWFASTNDRTGAVRLTAQPFPATKFDHIGLQPGAGGYYWARVVDTRGNPSAWHPVSSTGGLPATASTDPSLLLDQLQDALGMDQLAAELATPIGLISAADTVSGSVNARIKAAQDNLQAQINDLSGMPTYDAGTTYATDDIVQYDGGLYKALQATTGNLPTNTTYWVKIGDYTSLVDIVADHAAKIDAINTVSTGSTSAVAQAVAGLQADMTAAEGTISTHSTQISDRYTKAQTDSAISSASSTLTAAYQSADTATLNSAKSYSDAAIVTEQTARSSADNALATRTTNLETSVNSPITGLSTKASVAYVDQAKSDAISTSASSIAQVSARLDTGDYAAVKASAATSASKIAGVEAKYVLQVDANGKVAGMMLASGAGGTSFTILADKFLVYKPDGSGAGKQVFSIGTVNGVSALGFDGSAIFDGSIVARSIDTRGLTIKDASGNVILGSGTGLPSSYLSAGVGGNMIPNSDLSAGIQNWIMSWNQGGGTNYSAPVWDLAAPDWAPAGGHSVGFLRTGTTGAASGWFDIALDRNFSCLPSTRYELSAYLASHRCPAYFCVGFYKYVSNVLTYITESGFGPTTSVGGQNLANWGRVGGFVTTPSDCTMMRIWVRGGAATSESPYVWATRLFLAQAGSNQTELSPWSPGAATGVLSEQNTVSTGQVTGLGTLATQNAVDWNSQLVNIPAFGNFAYLSSITNANISTYIASGAIGTAYIANAAITSAKIGLASVDTLRVAGNAVTVATAGTFNTTANPSISLSLNFSEAPYGVLLVFRVERQVTVKDYADIEATWTVTIKRNGVIIATRNVSARASGGSWVTSRADLFVIDTPGPGYHTYSLERVTMPTYYSNTVIGSMFIQGAMR